MQGRHPCHNNIRIIKPEKLAHMHVSFMRIVWKTRMLALFKTYTNINICLHIYCPFSHIYYEDLE